MYTATNTDTPLKDVKNTASNIRDEAVNTAYGVKNDLQGAANQAGRKVRNFLDTAGDELSQTTDSITKQVRNNPVQSSLIAFGAGYIISALFRR